MKIAILTQPLGHNYGGLLQNFALQETLRRMGHEAITIDQSEIKTSSWMRFKADIKTFILRSVGKGKCRSYSGYSPTRKEVNIFRRNTSLFISKYIVHTKKVNNTFHIKKVIRNHNFDAYIVGSDQCWRPRYNKFLDFMFLSFLPPTNNAIKISYAASFGTDTWEYDDKLTSRMKLLVSKFNKISVREKSGIKMCKQYFDVDATQVLDPTMLLAKEDYIKLIEDCNGISVKGDLFYYILDPDENKMRFIESLAISKHYSIYTAVPKYQEETRTKRNIKRHILDCVYPPVTTWLKGILDAKIAVVDSFHGVVFCILFNISFWVLSNSKRGNARFDSILLSFNLSERLIDLNNFKKKKFDYNKPIDWDSVNQILEKEREISIKFLNDCLNLRQ